MSAHVVRAGAMLLGGDDLADAMTALEFQINVLRRNPDGVPVQARLLRLLDAMRQARSAGCAPQRAQLSEPVESSELPRDLITVKEAAELMNGCSQSNVRARCKRGSVWATKVGNEWRLSKADLDQRKVG